MAWSEVYEIPVKSLPYAFHLHGFSDLQIGSESSSPKVIKQRIEEICDDPCDSGVVILGDIEDEDRPSTRSLRKSAFADREEVVYRDAQKHMAWLDKEVIPLLLPLQKTKFGIMGVLAGHHWTQLSPVLNSVQYICNEVGTRSSRPVKYLGEMSAFLDFRFRYKNSPHGVRRVVHIQHGEGGGQTKTAALLRLDRTAQGFIADAFMRAHDCQIVAAKVDQLFPSAAKHGDVPELKSKTVAFLNLGSATRGYDFSKKAPSYIESGMMRPTTMGWGTFLFNMHKAHAYQDRSKNLDVDIQVKI